jgi:hypothetical protein
MCSSFLGLDWDLFKATEWRAELVASICYELFLAALAGVNLLEHAATFVLSVHNGFSIR